jgi:RimJ/RimL family protein N-acetyltransferase
LEPLLGNAHAKVDNRRVIAPNHGAPTGPQMKRHRLGSPWRERIVLDDRRELLLRPIEPADADAIREGFALLDPEEVRLRYQHPMKSLSEDYLHNLTHPRRGRDFVLVITEPLPPGEALIGAVARLSQVDGTREAEFAILVSHFIAGHGLGRLLMRKLVAYARRRRLDAIHGDVLDDNTPMLQLVEALGFRREASEYTGMTRVRLVLAQDQVNAQPQGQLS